MIFIRVVLSVFCGGIFYIGWMAVMIPILKSDFGGFAIQGFLWILAPVLTGLGFSAGYKSVELFPTTEKIPFWKICSWCVAACAVGSGIVFMFGPMLIVFGMFGFGTLSVIFFEMIRMRKLRKS